MSLPEIIGISIVWIGVFFCVVGIIGIIRLPDVFSRIHATGKVSALGVVGLLFGAAILVPELTPKILMFTLFLVITSPVASHAIAVAAYKQHPIAVERMKRDDLQSLSDTH